MLLLFGGIPIAMWHFTSLLLQDVLGYSALEAGLGQTPAAVAFVVVARLAAALLPRIGARALVLAGMRRPRGRFRLARPGPRRQRLRRRRARFHAAHRGGYRTDLPHPDGVATAEVADADAGIGGGLATTAVQVSGSVSVAVLATVASYDLVFLVAAGLGVVIAAGSVLLPRRRPR
jgi:hypothetical protein